MSVLYNEINYDKGSGAAANITALEKDLAFIQSNIVSLQSNPEMQKLSSWLSTLSTDGYAHFSTWWGSEYNSQSLPLSAMFLQDLNASNSNLDLTNIVPDDMLYISLIYANMLTLPDSSAAFETGIWGSGSATQPPGASNMTKYFSQIIINVLEQKNVNADGSLNGSGFLGDLTAVYNNLQVVAAQLQNTPGNHAAFLSALNGSPSGNFGLDHSWSGFFTDYQFFSKIASPTFQSIPPEWFDPSYFQLSTNNPQGGYTSDPNTLPGLWNDAPTGVPTLNDPDQSWGGFQFWALYCNPV
jgi:hypothetical protein